MQQGGLSKPGLRHEYLDVAGSDDARTQECHYIGVAIAEVHRLRKFVSGGP
jgi:hypothetical protein